MARSIIERNQVLQAFVDGEQVPLKDMVSIADDLITYSELCKEHFLSSRKNYVENVGFYLARYAMLKDIPSLQTLVSKPEEYVIKFELLAGPKLEEFRTSLAYNLLNVLKKSFEEEDATINSFEAMGKVLRFFVEQYAKLDASIKENPALFQEVVEKEGKEEPITVQKQLGEAESQESEEIAEIDEEDLVGVGDDIEGNALEME